ncbi:MAG: DUF5335 family protein [Acidobacteriota bacterium]
MPSREIPRDQWRTFFDSFSKDHEGWITTVELVGEDIPGDQIEALELPLVGISCDAKGSEADSIEVTIASDPSDEFTHIVHDAARVQFDPNYSGGREALEIESSEGDKTILTFRAASDATRTRHAGG